MRFVTFILALLLTTTGCLSAKFLGDLIVKIRRDGENLELMQPFAFEDNEKRVWRVPKGTIVNGASIPRSLWTIAGSPLTGKYREASVIHDYFCENKRRPWEQTHEVFYDAMIANGVGETKAKLFYLAVYRFGPRWDFSVEGWCKPGWACLQASEEDHWTYHFDAYTPDFNQKAFDDLKAQVASGTETEALKKRFDAQVRAEATGKAEAVLSAAPQPGKTFPHWPRP
jgi:Protein of unknown function (DUF1353)